MDKEKLIKLIKNSFPSSVFKDEGFTWSNEELLDLLLVISGEENLEEIAPEKMYLYILGLKKEIFWLLATSTAPYYKISVEDISIDKGDRFDHYYKLLQAVIDEERNYLASGKAYRIKVGHLFLNKNYYTNTTRENLGDIKVLAKVDKLGKDYVEISWKKFNNIGDKFSCYEIYLLEGEEPLVDKYNNNNIHPSALLIERITDIHRTFYRLKDLKPNQPYVIGVIAKNKLNMKGFTNIPINIKIEEGGKIDA